MEFFIEPQRENVFWYVFVPWNWQPIQKHYSFKHAKQEAQRIAEKIGKETFLLQAIKSYKINNLIETNFMHEPRKICEKE